MTPQIIVSEEKWRDAVEYLTGVGAGPYLSRGDQKFLAELRKQHRIITLESARGMLVKAGWSKAPAALGRLRDGK